MKQACRNIPRILRLLVLGALLGGGFAHADDYADINQLLRAGKPADALTKVDQRLTTTPRDPQLRFLRAVALTDAGKNDEAISTLLKLTEEYPELPEPYNNLAALYAGQNQLDKARVALEMAVRTNPTYAIAHENLGDIYAKLASQSYTKAQQLNGAAATSLQPKINLIRQLLSPAAATAPAPRPATPAAAAPAAVPSPAVSPAAAPAAASKDTGAVTAAVQAWASAWSSRDTKAFLAAYDASFKPAGNQSRSAWEQNRVAQIVNKRSISVTLSDLAVSVQGDKATANFRQEFVADNLRLNTRKTLQLVNSNNRWAIVSETIGS